MKNTVQLTKKMATIQSYVDLTTNEIALADFVVGYCNQIPFWQVTKQNVKDGRYNLLITDGSPTKLLYLGHLDTVQPKLFNNQPNTDIFINRNKLYGLGVADMKINISAFLTAWRSIGPTQGVAALLYIDEEYDFAGMKKFIEEYKDKVKPSLILSGDGNDLTLGNGCRGLIEITVRVRGKTGHASNPLSGVNAITRSYAVIWRLQKYFQKFCRSQDLGKTTINLAYLQGGLLLKKEKQNVTFGKEGNNIPDVAEFVLDIRPSVASLNANRVGSLLEGFIADEHLTLESFTVRHDLGAWITPRDQLDSIVEIINTETPFRWTDSGKRGFIDIQLLTEAFPTVPCCTFGAGDGRTVHREDENVPLEQINKLETIYRKIILAMKGGEYYDLRRW